MRGILIVWLVFFFVHAECQRSPIDSLLRELDRARTDAELRVDILNKIAYEYYENEPQKGFEYTLLALKLARDLEYKPGERLARTLLGYHFHSKGDFARSRAEFRIAAEVQAPGTSHLPRGG